MGGFSDYLEQRTLRHIFGIETYIPPTYLYVALFTEHANDAYEVNTNYGYSRIRTNSDDWYASFVLDGEVFSKGYLTFGPATSPWGTIRFVGIYDAATDGVLLFDAAAETPKTIETGDTYTSPQQGLKVRLD